MLEVWSRARCSHTHGAPRQVCQQHSAPFTHRSEGISLNELFNMCMGKSQNLQIQYTKNVITIWKMVISPRKSCFICLKLTYTFAFFLSFLLVTFSHLCTLLALWNKPLVWKRAVKHNTELYKTEKIGILSHYMGSNFRWVAHSVVASETALQALSLLQPHISHASHWLQYFHLFLF